jgi:hypothetical protein
MELYFLYYPSFDVVWTCSSVQNCTSYVALLLLDPPEDLEAVLGDAHALEQVVVEVRGVAGLQLVLGEEEPVLVRQRRRKPRPRQPRVPLHVSPVTPSADELSRCHSHSRDASGFIYTRKDDWSGRSCMGRQLAQLQRHGSRAGHMASPAKGLLRLL